MPISTLPEHQGSAVKSLSKSRIEQLGGQGSSPQLNKLNNNSKNHIDTSDLTNENESTEVDISLSELQVMDESHIQPTTTSSRTAALAATDDTSNITSSKKNEEDALQGLYDEYKADFDQAIGSIKQFFHFLVNEKTYEDKKTSYTIGISGDSEQNPKVKFNRKNKDLAYFKEDSIVHFLKRIF